MGRGARGVARELIGGDSLHVADSSRVQRRAIAQTRVSGLPLATRSTVSSYSMAMAGSA